MMIILPCTCRVAFSLFPNCQGQECKPSFLSQILGVSFLTENKYGCPTIQYIADLDDIYNYL